MKDVDLYSGEEVTKLLIGNKDDRPDAKVVDPEQECTPARRWRIRASILEHSSAHCGAVIAAFGVAPLS